MGITEPLTVEHQRFFALTPADAFLKKNCFARVIRDHSGNTHGETITDAELKERSRKGPGSTDRGAPACDLKCPLIGFAATPFTKSFLLVYSGPLVNTIG